MSRWLARAGRVLALPAGLAGGLLGATLAAAQPGGTGLPGMALGWLYGVVVRACIRAFRVPAGAYPLVGLLCGPLPFALLMPRRVPAEERGIVWVGLVAGLVIGTIEWAYERWRRAAPAGPTEVIR